MGKKVFKNARIFTLDSENPYIENGYLVVTGDKFTEIGLMSCFNPTRHADGQVIDLKGKIVAPGMICSHSHFYGQFVRGIPLAVSPVNWQQILAQMWWKVDKALDPEEIYYSAMMGIIEGIKAGTTTYIDHHASPSSCRGSLDIIEKAVLDTGVRACLAYEVSDRDGEKAALEGIEENIEFIKKVSVQNSDQVRGTFGLHASYTLSDETLKDCVSEAKKLGVGFHVHVAEDIADVTDSYRKAGVHVVERLANMGVLGEKTVAAHCVHVGPEQWEIFKSTGTKVAHNCQSNTNNAVGISPVYHMLKAGVQVALASDGYTYDMFKELSFASILQKLANKDPRIMGSQCLDQFVYRNNFSIANTFFSQPVGELKKGNLADFIAVAYDPPTPLNLDNFYSHLTSGFSGNVDTVVVGGKILLKDKVLVNIDEKEIFAKCREQAHKLWSKL
jgi:putative selenium metabolism protein SsnA